MSNETLTPWFRKQMEDNNSKIPLHLSHATKKTRFGVRSDKNFKSKSHLRTEWERMNPELVKKQRQESMHGKGKAVQ